MIKKYPMDENRSDQLVKLHDLELEVHRTRQQVHDLEQELHITRQQVSDIIKCKTFVIAKLITNVFDQGEIFSKKVLALF
jgi:hypothetical protein